MPQHSDTGYFACSKDNFSPRCVILDNKILCLSSVPWVALMSLGGVCFRWFFRDTLPPLSPSAAPLLGEKESKKWWQLLLWPDQSRSSNLLKYPSSCMAVNGRAGKVATVKGRAASSCQDTFNAEHWPETACSSHRGKSLVHHIKKQSQVIFTQKKTPRKCGYKICRV